MNQIFQVPLETEFLEELGVEPSRSEDGDTFTLNLSETTGESLSLTASEAARSVRIAWDAGKGRTIDTYREGATYMRIDSRDGRTAISIGFSLGETQGELKLQVFPHIEISDRQLFV
ncbi:MULTISPECIES: hypothetical protein [unclassified Streptomyces]|uniref:hypothetical protein n=1 Tax=unclassified Streptomyces TaxID=2593676 RepID=UPI002E177DCD|nr:MULTISPECIES: hypothetical protein [unclassified Streptomyces]